MFFFFHKKTRLFFQLAKGAAKLPNDDEQRKIIIATDKTLGDQCNFLKKQYLSLHTPNTIKKIK